MDSKEIELKNSVELKRLGEHYKRMDDKMNTIESDVKEIKNAILGTEFEDEGIVKKLKLLREDIDKNKEKQIKIEIYMGLFFGIYTIVIGGLVVILLKYIFKGL